MMPPALNWWGTRGQFLSLFAGETNLLSLPRAPHKILNRIHVPVRPLQTIYNQMTRQSHPLERQMRTSILILLLCGLVGAVSAQDFAPVTCPDTTIIAPQMTITLPPQS